MVSMKGWLRDALAIEKAACADVLEDAKLRGGRGFLEVMEQRTVMDNIKESPGMQTYERLIETLDKFGVRRSAMQKRFHEAMCHAFIPLIFGDDYQRHYTAIINYLGITKINPRLLFYTPRREGKTWSVAMMIAALLWACDDMDPCAIGLTIRVARQTMKLVQMFFSRLPGAAGRIISHSAEEFVVRNFSGTGNNTFTSLPAQTDTIRGKGGKPIFCDEVSFFPVDVMTESVFPMMQPARSAAVFISTPPRGQETGALLWETMQHKITGELLFETVKIRRVCPECDLKQLTTCPHAAIELPPWKSQAQQSAIESMYMATDSKALAREMHGLEVTDDVKVFKRDNIEQIVEAKRVVVSTVVPVIFIAVDPSGGGETSNTSVVILSFNQHHQPVVSHFTNTMCMRISYPMQTNKQ